jgi:dethiobiotin synthetase
MHLFVTAIGTDSGKTLVSAILTKALEATYWKPVQAGEPTDTQTIQSLIPSVKIIPELYKLAIPASPHFAANAENIIIDLHELRIPPLETEHLVVEGAGGLMVPLNEKDFVIDIPQFLSLEVVLVVNLYLGCINHSLLAINEINRRNVRVKGIVFNGDLHNDSAEFIAHYSGWPILAHIPKLNEITPEVIAQMAQELLPALV